MNVTKFIPKQKIKQHTNYKNVQWVVLSLTYT